jgi:hypothetical protein
MNDSSEYTGNHLIWLAMFLICGGNVGKRLRMTALTEAIISGEFLEYDPAIGMHTVGNLQRALMDLESHVARWRALGTSDVFAIASELVQNQQYKSKRESPFSIPNERLLVPFAIHDIAENILALSKAIYQALNGNVAALASVRLRPSSPIEEENECIEAERPSNDDVIRWLAE